jgi:ABC-type oligopeptide transport system ATPase subunit
LGSQASLTAQIVQLMKQAKEGSEKTYLFASFDK